MGGDEIVSAAIPAPSRLSCQNEVAPRHLAGFRRDSRSARLALSYFLFWAALRLEAISMAAHLSLQTTSCRRMRPLPPSLRWFLLVLACLLASAPAFAQSSQPRTVSFPSADGQTTLTGYLFPPAGRPKIAPAVVLLHGRGGVYLARAKGNYSSVTLARGIRSWANLWAGQGYWVLVVDSFGPRGYPGGLPGARTGAPNELAVRPLDAYGALRYLRGSPRVRPDRIALEGWSTGGDVALETLDKSRVPLAVTQSGRGFRAAVVFSPHCEALGRLKSPYVPYAPVRIFVGGHGPFEGAADCQKAASAGKAAGGDITTTVFAAASANFDDPARERPSSPANAAAATTARQQAVALLVAALGH
jgi:carboxymethylenebutenolidase